MGLPDFEIHLGNGVYINSAGDLRVGTPPAGSVPVYSPPFTLPIDPDKLKDAVSSATKALKEFTEDKENEGKFKRFGYADKIFKALVAFTEVASVIAPVVSVFAITASVLKMFGLFKSGPTPFEASVQESLDKLQTSFRLTFSGLSKIEIDRAKAGLEDAWKAVDGYHSLLRHGNPTLDQAQTLFADMKQKVESVGQDIEHLLGQVIWNTVFDRDSYSLWAYNQHRMKTLPRAGTTDFEPAYLPGDETLAFDHRMMLPIAIYAATTYLGCLRGADPEYRTTGAKAPKLRGLANKLDDLAELMRKHGLGRFVYRREDFLRISSSDVNHVRVGAQWVPLGIKPTCAAFPVGALDLRYHDNDFFASFLQSLAQSEARNEPHPTQKAGIDFRWIPPAQLAPADMIPGQPGFPPSSFEILNPDECATAANARSEHEYADLLTTSGYLELVRVAALMRNEATQPRVSQTIDSPKLVTFRDPEAAQNVEISSGGSGWVAKTEGTARREAQKFAARLSVSTQPIERPWPIQYKVYLRTLNHGAVDRSWTEREYEDYCSAYYTPKKETTPTGGEWINQELVIQTLQGVLLDQKQIATGVSSFDRSPSQGEIELNVDTFDWWIPVHSSLSMLDNPAVAAAALSGINWFPDGPSEAGGNSPPNDEVPAAPSGRRRAPVVLGGSLLGNATQLGNFDYFGWKSGQKDWEGEKRDPKRSKAKLRYELVWQGHSFRLQIETRPEDRNFLLFLVFEEKFPSTPNTWLHTAIPIPVNGCLTYVPEEFFEREAQAVAQAGRAIAEFYKRRLVQPQDIGPFPDPTFELISPSDLLNRHKVTVLSEHLKGLGANFQDLLGNGPG